MGVKFIHNIPFEKTQIFEDLYHPNLQTDIQTKQDIKKDGGEFVYLWDTEENKPIGQTYFIPLDAFINWEADEEQPEDGLDKYYYQNGVYVFGTEILPDYQRQGYGKLLKAYSLGIMRTSGYKFVMGHARVSTGSINLNEYFGARRIGPYKNWYQTGETHILYKLDL